MSPKEGWRCRYSFCGKPDEAGRLLLTNRLVVESLRGIIGPTWGTETRNWVLSRQDHAGKQERSCNLDPGQKRILRQVLYHLVVQEEGAINFRCRPMILGKCKILGDLPTV